MSKITLNNVADLTSSSTAQTTINTNFNTVQAAFDNTLSRDGTSPNTMGAVLDMNSFNIINLPTPASVNSPARLIDVTSNPTITVPPTGTSGSTVPLLNGINTWSAQQTMTSRTVVNYTPVFDLAGNIMSVAILFPDISITVPASGIYHDIRMSGSSGTAPTITVGASGLYSSIFIDPIIGSGSDVTSNAYGAVIQATNAGPGTVKGIHGGIFGSGSSTGTLVGFNFQIQPVATQGYTAGGFCSLTSSGVNNKAIGYGIESSGDQYVFALGNAVAALPIGTDFIRWWQHSSSAAGANFLNLLASDGVTTNFKVDKSGNTTTLGTLASAAITSTGAITGTAYKISTNQVVGARVTGYTAMTGSPDKATAYATGSVTLPQLAGRVAQLQADLTAHGLIGT